MSCRLCGRDDCDRSCNTPPVTTDGSPCHWHTKSKKIQLVLDEEALAVLATLQAATGATSMAEVLRDALGVYNSLQELTAGGAKKLALVDREAGEMQELFVPSLLRKHAIVQGEP